MWYDLSNPLQAQSARTRLEQLIKRQTVVELREKPLRRSIQANKYLHLILGFFASQTGETLDYVKRNYYKAHCNADIFIREKYDPFLKRNVKWLRSSADLTKEEMSRSIDRFRNFSSSEAGIYIPSSDEAEFIRQMEIEVERYRQYM